MTENALYGKINYVIYHDAGFAFVREDIMLKSLEIYNETNKKLKALGYAGYLIGWDIQTEAPKRANHFKETETLSEMQYKLSTSPEYKCAIIDLYAHLSELDEVLAHEITLAKEGIEKLEKIPMEEYIRFQSLTNEFYNVYVDAKQNNDFKSALPYYEKIVDYRRRYVKWLETPDKKGYDVLLDEFERDLTMKDCDEFFTLLKEKLVPLIKEISHKKPLFDDSFNKKIYPAAGQKEFQEYIRKVMGFNPDYTVVKESEHPFTTNNTVTDVRITNHFYENNFTSSIFSAIHEMGHGLYELQCDPELDETMSAGGVSMAMHESQSRLMENMIGRSRAFWETHFKKLCEIFPENLKNVTVNDMFLLCNRVECSLIRTEADELTYSLHIMIRYEIEKALISGEIEAKDIPATWNKLYKEYLGIDVPNDGKGCLQDVHWCYGEFGYFPTYALGSAYAAQIYDAMAKDLDINEEIKSGTVAGLENWLKEHIHKYGSSKFSKDILFIATKENFNPAHYVNYLVNKYSEIYGIKK